MTPLSRNIILLTLSCALVVVLTGCQGESSESDGAGTQSDTTTAVSVRLPIPVVDAAFAPFYIGQDRGIFDKHGIDLTLEPGTPELNPTKMVDQGTDEFGVAGGPELVMSARNGGASVVGVALLHYESNFVVVLTKKGSGLTQITDLDGKDVGFFYGHISTDVLRALFSKEGVDVNEVDVGFNYGQFISDRLLAQWAFRTTAGITLPARGVDVNQISPADYGIVTHGHTVFASESYVRDNPEIAQRFVAALIEATQYALDNPEEAIQVTLDRDKDGNLDRNIVEQQWQIYAEVIRNNPRIGHIDMAAMKRTRDRQAGQSLVPEDFSVDSAFTNRFIDALQSTENP